METGFSERPNHLQEKKESVISKVKQRKERECRVIFRKDLLSGGEVFVKVLKRQGESDISVLVKNFIYLYKMNKYFGVTATTRNLKTVTEVLKM